MGARLFGSGCRVNLNQVASGDLECLDVDVNALQYSPIEQVAPYYQDFGELLELYPVFTLELPFMDGLLFETGDRALFIEEDGFLVVLKEANVTISSYVQAVIETNWTVLTSIKIETPYETYNLLYLNGRYNLFNGEVNSTAWGFFDTTWSQEGIKWGGAKSRRQYLYRQGDTFITISPCQDLVSLYIVTEDVETANYTGEADKWKKVACVRTGFNKCLGYKRKKHPTDLYEVVQIGSNSDYVEAPKIYEPLQPLY